MEVLNYH